MTSPDQQPQRPCRARELGIRPGTLPPGPLNAVTDVAGVRVGHRTVVEGDDVRTGVTAVVPTGTEDRRRTLPAAVSVGNGHGKLVGATQVDELGVVETPILLTATLSTFRVADALVSYLLAQPAYDDVRSINPFVGETNDGHLSDIRRRPVTEAHVHAALRDATAERPAEGCVGAGTGTVALGYKAGIGTASRRVDVDGSTYTLGALVQSNFSGRLTVLGVDAAPDRLLTPPPEPIDPPGNSCMIVLATDARLDARQLDRLARRAVFALARVGSHFTQGSGDYAVAFSTVPDGGVLPDKQLNGMFLAALEAVEESVLNSLLMATTTVGFRGHRAAALPPETLVDRLVDAGVLA